MSTRKSSSIDQPSRLEVWAEYALAVAYWILAVLIILDRPLTVWHGAGFILALGAAAGWIGLAALDHALRIMRRPLVDPQPQQDPKRVALGCPSWCNVDHDQADERSRFVTEDGFAILNERHHERTVFEAKNPGRGPNATVAVTVQLADDLDDARRVDKPTVTVRGGELLDPLTARRLSWALREAADLAKQPVPDLPKPEKVA